MKRLLVFGAAALIAGTAANAYTINDMDVADADEDGYYSLDELKVAFPDLSDGTFDEIDTDDDGVASVEELDAAVQAGLFKS